LLTVLKAIRVHQWVKNLLLFAPAILAHEFDGPELTEAVLGFIAFCLAASAGYVVNDLLDLEADRKHPSNSRRPIASGAIGIPTAILLAAACLAGGMVLSLLALSWEFTGILGLYLGLSLFYSARLKHLLVVDVLVLASLYSIRIIAGGIASAVSISGWLISFSVFFFLGLALLKRYVEFGLERSDNEPGSARAYSGNDVTIVGTFGMVSGMLAVLVFVLYLNSAEVVVLYSRPRLLWWVNIPLIYWTMRMWLNASQGRMQSDPILSAIKDPASYVCGGATALLLFLAIG